MSGRGGLDPNEEGDDWARYGGARRRAPGAESEDLLRDDPFADYRHENGRQPTQAGAPSRPRARSNALGALVAVAVVAVVAGIVNVAASNVAPAPSPTRTPRPGPTVAPSALLPISRATLRMALVAVTIPIPLPVAVADRAFPADDGVRMYLAGNSGAVPVDVAAGRAGKVWSGPDFPKGLRRVIYDRGVWVSSWPAGSPFCGPPCWDKATTYRIDPDSGAVTLKLEGAYLVGAQFDGVYVASTGRLRTLDPTDGHEVSSIAWRSAGEPRLGCTGVWSVELGQKTELTAVNATSGDQLGSSSLPSTMAYGPLTVESQCWMMSGRDGASAGQTRLTMLNSDASVLTESVIEGSLVILDGEFWRLDGDGSIQRYEAVSAGIGYGQRYMLPIGPENGDPAGLFAAVGSMWLYRGQELVGFDILTGSANAN